jgi:hypothetical protein
VDPPAAGQVIHDGQAPPAQPLKRDAANNVLETMALVDHLDPHAVVVDMRAQGDLATPVQDGVGDQLAHDQPDVLHLLALERDRCQPVRDRSARDAGGLPAPRQVEFKLRAGHVSRSPRGLGV